MKEMSNQTLGIVGMHFAEHKLGLLKLWRKVKLE